MQLTKIDILYNPNAQDFFHKVDSYDVPHYQKFLVGLRKNMCLDDIIIINDWREVRNNSFIVLYEYQGFYEDLKKYFEKVSQEVFRRVFIISNTFREYYHPHNYREKSFAGSAYNIAYDFFAQGGSLDVKYPSFYADEIAVNVLRNKSEKHTWRVTETSTEFFGYVVIYNKVNLVEAFSL